MPSTYAHEPDMRTLVTITRCVSAMQHSEIQSCAALFSDAHDSLMRDSCTSHARVRREGGPTGYVSGTREPLRGKQPSSTMRRTGWPEAVRRALAFEDSSPPPLPSFSKHAVHRECSPFFTSTRLAEEDIRVEEYVLGRNSDRNASGMRHGEAHDTQSAESRAYWNFGSLQQDRDLIRSGTDARGAQFSAFDAPDASRAASLVSPSGAAARTVLQLSTSRSYLQRQPPSPPPSGPQSGAAVATPGLSAHPLRLNISADVCSKNSRASNRRHLTLSSLSVSKVNDTSCTTRTDSASSVDGLCNAGGFDLAQTSSARHSSHQALQRQPDSQDKHASSRPTRWMTSEEGEASLASLVQKPVHNGSVAPSVAASLSPPSVTAAVARNGRRVTSSDTEALRPSARPAGAYSPPQSSSASVASFYSHFFSSAGRGGRRSTSRSTSMRREGRMYEAEATATDSGGTRALSHAATAVAVAGAAGRFALDARGHPADRRADDVNASAVRVASDRPQRATRAVSEKSPSADRVPSRPAASSSLDLERYTLPVEMPPLLSTAVLAVTASKASPVPFSSRSLRFSPPSAAAAVVAGEARVMGALSSQKSTRKSETANVRCRDMSHASASSSRASGLASASIAMAAKADARLAEAPPTPPDGLSRPEAANTGAARRQYPSPPPLPSPCRESSPGAHMWRAGALVQQSLSLHGSRGAEPVSERVGETLLEPPACAASPSYSLPRRRRSPLEGAANMPDVAGRDAQSSVSAVAGTRDIAGPVQSVADGGQRKALSDSAARLGPREKIVHGFRRRQHAAPQSKAIDATDEPPTAVSEMEDDVPREADTRTAGDPMCRLSREVSEERRNEQQQQQKWHHYVMYVPPVRAPGASPLSRRSVVAASTHHRQMGVPLSTSLGVFSATAPPPLAQRGNCSPFLAGGGGDNASVRSPAIAARRGVQEATNRTGSGCARCSPAASKLEAEELGHGGATAATAEAPERSRLKPPALSHAAVASMGRSEEGRGSHRCRSGSGVRASDAGGEGFDNESRTNGTTAHRPRRYHGDSESTTRHRVTTGPAACHAPFDSLHSASADSDWVANDHAAQQRLQRFTGDAGPLAVPSSIDTAVTGSPSALAELAVREGFVRRGRVMGSQAPAAPLPTCGALETEDLDQSDPTLSVQRADSCTSHFEVLLCTSFDSQTRYETPPHSPYTPVLGSSLTNRAGIPCMDSFASLEHTPLTRSVTSAAAMEGSATECDAPVMSTFFADDHVADAIPAAVAARQVTGGRDEDVADDVPATQGLVLGVEEKAEVHIRPHHVESDSGPVPHLSVERSSSLGSQNPDQPSCATQPAGRTFGDVGAEAAHPTPPTSSGTRNVLAACSHRTPLDSCLHSNSVFRAWPTHTCHAASASASRGLREVCTGPSNDLGTSEEAGNSDGDGVEDSLDDAPMLWDRHAPYPTPALSIDGGDVYSSVPSASTPPPPPRGPLHEPRQQLHRQRETSLLSSSSAHVNDAEDTVAALKPTVIAHGTGGCRAESGEGSRRHVAPEFSSSIVSINAVSSATTSSRLRRGHHPGERQEEKHESDDVPETYTQRLQQWQQAQDNDVQPQALYRVLSSDFFASRLCPCRGSESTQPYDAEGSHGRGDMLDGLEHEPNTIVNDGGGGGGEDCGDFAASAPSSLPSRAGTMQANALIGSAAAESREGRPSTAAYASTCATASATAVPTAAAAKTPECRAPASWQRTRLSIPVVLSKPPIDAGASRRRLTNGLRRSSALPFSDGDSAVVSQAAGIYPRRQRAMTAAEADSFGADADEDEDEDEDGGYCSYGYESDLVYV